MPQMLLPIFSKDVTLINPLIGYAKRDRIVYYFNGQMPIFSHNEKDEASFKSFMAQLYINGNATQSEINRAFGMNKINMKRWVKRYREKGPGVFYKKETKTSFKKANDISNGGVLFSLPALLSNSLLDHTKKHFSFPPGFYGVKHIFITLAFVTLLRIKSIEAVQYCSPGELGKVLGLDRIPEIKTIRRKLGILARQDSEKQWSRDLSKDWLSENAMVSGILYIDGHVRIYHGKRTKLPKRYVTR